MKVLPCIRCGFCCCVSVCPYGDWDEVKKQCRFLTKENLCEKYDEIVKSPGSVISPAFGAGCSSTLFNERRRAKELELASK